MEFSTQRCYVACFSEENIDAFMEYRNNLVWMEHQSFKGLTREEYRVALLTPKKLTDGIQLAVSHKDTHELIGDVFLLQEKDICWLGYTISPKHARQGYAYEVAIAAIHTLASRGIKEVKAGVLAENTASVNLLKKLGFAFVCVEDDEQIYSLRTMDNN